MGIEMFKTVKDLLTIQSSPKPPLSAWVKEQERRDLTKVSSAVSGLQHGPRPAATNLLARIKATLNP